MTVQPYGLKVDTIPAACILHSHSGDEITPGILVADARLLSVAWWQKRLWTLELLTRSLDSTEPQRVQSRLCDGMKLAAVLKILFLVHVLSPQLACALR